MNPSLLRSIGDRPLSLAGHLRQTATHVAQGRFAYNFAVGHTCNVGCVARTVLDMDGYTMAKELCAIYQPLRELTGKPANWDNWANTARNACPLTPGKFATGIIGQLQRAGLTVDDFDHLEHLSHPALKGNWAVVEGKRHYEIATNYVVYLQNWANAIETYRAAHPEAASAPTDAQLDAIEARPLVAAS